MYKIYNILSCALHPVDINNPRLLISAVCVQIINFVLVFQNESKHSSESKSIPTYFIF